MAKGENSPTNDDSVQPSVVSVLIRTEVESNIIASTEEAYPEEEETSQASNEETGVQETNVSVAEENQYPLNSPFVQGIDDLPDIIDKSDEEEEGEIQDSPSEQAEEKEKAPPKSTIVPSNSRQ